jgi:hypothetical protein
MGVRGLARAAWRAVYSILVPQCRHQRLRHVWLEYTCIGCYRSTKFEERAECVDCPGFVIFYTVPQQAECVWCHKPYAGDW